MGALVLSESCLTRHLASQYRAVEPLDRRLGVGLLLQCVHCIIIYFERSTLLHYKIYTVSVKYYNVLTRASTNIKSQSVKSLLLYPQRSTTV